MLKQKKITHALDYDHKEQLYFHYLHEYKITKKHCGFCHFYCIVSIPMGVEELHNFDVLNLGVFT